MGSLHSTTTPTIPAKMHLKSIISFSLLVLFSATVDAAPRKRASHHGLCECINPFQGTKNAYRGDPEQLCNNGPGFCYVRCDHSCRDQSPTASYGRCQSSLACDAYNGHVLTILAPY